jgi:hypothetical protein
MKMNLHYKHLGMYLLAGIASGALCHLIYDTDNVWQLYVGPPLVLGIVIFFSGRYISDIIPRNTWISPLAFVLSCTIGWILAIEFGGEYYDETDLWLIASGVIGGAGVAVGFVAAWRVQKIWVVSVMITAAGGLGGAVLILLDIAGIHFVSLFVVWQSIVLLGAGFATQIDSKQASQKKSKSLRC